MRRSIATVLLGVCGSLAGPHALATEGEAASATPALNLRLAPDLTPPALRTRPPAAAGAATPRPEQAIFLRADWIEGVGKEHVDAGGHVELRTRRETVLADWLRYEFADDEIWGKGDVLLRRGIDWITGPEARYRPETET